MEIIEIKNSKDLYKFMTDNIEYGGPTLQNKVAMYLVNCLNKNKYNKKRKLITK